MYMRHIGITLFTLLAVLFFSCKGDPEKQEAVLHVRLKKDPERINPLIFPNPTSREVYQYIHLPLADYNPESLTLEPILIKQIPTEVAIDTGKYKGGIAFDLEFSDQATWDNGSPITVNDYIFTLKAINLPMTNAGKYRDLTQNITDIIPDPADSKKCKVVFAKDYMLALETCVNIEVYPQYFYDSLNVLAKYAYSEFTEDNIKKLSADSTLVQFADAFNSNIYSREKISGSGPYKFVSWTADQNIVLQKKENFWGKNLSTPILKQGPEKLIFQIIPDETAAIAQLKAGTIDVMTEVSGDNYNALEKDDVFGKQFSFYHPALIKQYYIILNNQDEILKDQKIRKALAHLLDVQSILDNLEGGKGMRTVAPIHPLKKTFNKNLVPVPFDVDKAKSLIAEAGWTDSNSDGIADKKINGKIQNLELEILISGQELGKKLSLLLQENGTKAGVKIIITEKDFKLIRAEHVKTRKYQLVASVLSQDLQTWDDMSKWHSENDTPDGSNEMSYRSSAADALIDQILQTKDDAKRVELYQKIQEQIYNDQPAIFMYAPEERIVISKKWKSSATVKRPGYLANTFEFVGATTSK
jgi:peptide/nickel transport system substrate-binding protein